MGKQRYKNKDVLNNYQFWVLWVFSVVFSVVSVFVASSWEVSSARTSSITPKCRSSSFILSIFSFNASK